MFRVTWSERFFFFFSQIRYRNALTEKAWEDAIQGLGIAMSTVASEKNKELLFIGNVFLQQVTSPRVVSQVFPEHTG